MNNRLKEIRTERGFTLEALANATEIKRTNLSYYENEKTRPKPEAWQKLAQFYGVSVPYLQGFGISRNELNAFICTVLIAWQKPQINELSKQARAMVEAIGLYFPEPAQMKQLKQYAQRMDFANLGRLLFDTLPMYGDYDFLASLDRGKVASGSDEAVQAITLKLLQDSESFTIDELRQQIHETRLRQLLKRAANDDNFRRKLYKALDELAEHPEK